MLQVFREHSMRLVLWRFCQSNYFVLTNVLHAQVSVHLLFRSSCHVRPQCSRAVCVQKVSWLISHAKRWSNLHVPPFWSRDSTWYSLHTSLLGEFSQVKYVYLWSSSPICWLVFAKTLIDHNIALKTRFWTVSPFIIVRTSISLDLKSHMHTQSYHIVRVFSRSIGSRYIVIRGNYTHVWRHRV